MATIIQTHNLCKFYGLGETEVKALKGVSMAVEQGEFVAIMGSSGSGKSTLLNILGCLDRPTAGEYFLAGEDVSHLDKVQLAGVRNRKIGFVFQSFNLLPRTTALDNVLLPLVYQRPQKLTPAERQTKAMKALEAVGLKDRAHHHPNELSGGQKQRVAIARALVNDPALIIADEPTGNLDTQTSQEIMALLHALHGRGSTIVLVTHEADISAQTQRTIVLRDGLIETEGR